MAVQWPGAARVAQVAAAGAVMALGHAPFGAWYATLAGLVALLWLVARASGWGAAAWLGLFGGAGYFAAALNWLVDPFLVDAATYGWMAPFALGFMAFGLALFWAGAAAGSVLMVGKAATEGRRALAFAVTLALAELLRGYVLTGFPWALIGHVWIETPVAQVAAWVGPAGLTLLTTLAAALVLVRRWRWVGPVALAGAWGYGHWVLGVAMPPDLAVTLRLVQPNAAQAMKWDPAEAEKFMDRLLSLTAVRPAPDLVIWPETALPYLLDRHPELRPYMVQAAGGAALAFGMQRLEEDRAYNSLAVMDPSGEIVQSYDKHHLVPFGEYIPFGDLAYRWFGISAFAAQAGNGYTAGSGPALLDFGPRLGRALPLICYEAVFPQDLRGTERPDWLLQVTNDAWFGSFSGPFQHADQARLRAIEQGLPLVRVANTGVTAVYDARGRLREALPFQVASYLDTPLPAALPATFYARWGEGPVLVLLAGLGLALARRARPLNA